MRVSKADYQDQVEEIDVNPGDRVTRFCPLTPLYGYVEISSSVSAGADVFIGSKFAGKTPLRTSLKPGTYELKFVMTGMRERIETITILPGETLTPEPYILTASPSAPARYLLKVSSDPPGASVTINGIPHRDKTPFTVDCDRPDVHLAIEKEGYGSKEEVLTLRPRPFCE